MHTLLRGKLFSALAPLVLVMSMAAWSTSVSALSCTQGSTCINVDKGEDAYTKEMARQSKEQWDDTRSLRHKVNKHVEKQFDKYDQAVDAQEACESSSNFNAYWEPNTRRCLDRNTGRVIR